MHDRDFFDILRDIFTNKRAKEFRKKYWNLKQLDRIEYSLHYQEIRKKHMNFSSIPFLWTLFFLNTGLLMFTILAYHLIGESVIPLIKVLPKVAWVSAFAWTLVFFGDTISFLNGINAFKKLRKRFNLN